MRTAICSGGVSSLEGTSRDHARERKETVSVKRSGVMGLYTETEKRPDNRKFLLLFKLAIVSSIESLVDHALI